jgi:hypothetical protein
MVKENLLFSFSTARENWIPLPSLLPGSTRLFITDSIIRTDTT